MVITRFALIPLSVPKPGVPSRSFIKFDGTPTGLLIEGTNLERQHETYSGFLLWLTYDEHLARLNGNPLHIYLISPALTVLDVRSVAGGTLAAGRLRNLFKTGDDIFQFSYFGSERWRLTVMKEPRRQIVRRAYDWGQQGPAGVHHTALFAHRYLELERVVT